jgi:hypothetical protein
MSYESQAALQRDPIFQGRCSACLIQQSDSFINDGRADIAALAASLLRIDIAQTQAFITAVAAGPGLAEKVDNGDGTIDQSKVTDDDLLATVQAEYPKMAALFFDPDGNPKGA